MSDGHDAAELALLREAMRYAQCNSCEGTFTDEEPWLLVDWTESYDPADDEARTHVNWHRMVWDDGRPVTADDVQRLGRQRPDRMRRAGLWETTYTALLCVDCVADVGQLPSWRSPYRNVRGPGAALVVQRTRPT